MPELPEVETIVRGLRPLVRGRRITEVAVEWARTVDASSLPLERLIGDTIVGVQRAGKFIVFELASGFRLAAHLRMTGRLMVTRTSGSVPYAKVILRLGRGGALIFADVRKFGRVRLFRGDCRQVLGIGVDPFDRGLDEAAFKKLLAGRRTPIKAWLLDQRRIAGIGNIYAAEALFYAGLRPRRRAGDLTARQRGLLLKSLRQVLRRAIAHRGSSVDDYVDAEGNEGGFQNLLAVYGRAGSPCRRCQASVRRVLLAQRSTFYCPACQQ